MVFCCPASFFSPYHDNDDFQSATAAPPPPLSPEQRLPDVECTQPFLLPIEYLSDSVRHTVPDSVLSDLEMTTAAATDADSAALPMYKLLLLSPEMRSRPQSDFCFAHTMFPQWTTTFTSDIAFLQQTQHLLRTFAFPGHPVDNTAAAADAANLYYTVWREIKECASESDFHQKYNYVDWKCIEFLNTSPLFMECLAAYSILCPLLSLIIPIITTILPFFILKLSGVEVTFETYLAILTDIGRSTFLGKTIGSVCHGAAAGAGGGDVSASKFFYVGATVGIYAIQMYQNTVFCCRYIEKTRQMFAHIRALRNFVADITVDMDAFSHAAAASSSCPAYNEFAKVTRAHISTLRAFADRCDIVVRNGEKGILGTFTPGVTGCMLTQFYDFYKNPDLHKSFQYAFGFEAFKQHFTTLQQHIADGRMTAATFDAAPPAVPNEQQEDVSGNIANQFIGQAYLPLVVAADDTLVKNDVSLAKSIVLTGPNASGKTTLLKTTLLNVLFTQQFGFGFYESCRLSQPYTHLHSYINIPDTSSRDSLFQAESRRCKGILDAVAKTNTTKTQRHLCIMDEIFTGTNPVDAARAARSFVSYLRRFDASVDFMLTTHFLELCPDFQEMGLQMRRMQVKKSDADDADDGDNYEFTYCVEEGISDVHGAAKILNEMQFPKEMMEDIQK